MVKKTKIDSQEDKEDIEINSPISLDNLDKETQIKIQEMQILEHNFEQLLLQKQAFTLELNDTKHSLEELEKASDEVFKIVGRQIIIRTKKEDLQKDLSHKQELIELRLKNIEKQEEEFSKKVVSLREEIVKAISTKKI